MIGYKGATNYRVLLADGTIHVTNNVVFDERWDCLAPDTAVIRQQSPPSAAGGEKRKKVQFEQL